MTHSGAPLSEKSPRSDVSEKDAVVAEGLCECVWLCVYAWCKFSPAVCYFWELRLASCIKKKKTHRKWKMLRQS